jgi:hypothetical protein
MLKTYINAYKTDNLSFLKVLLFILIVDIQQNIFRNHHFLKKQVSSTLILIFLYLDIIVLLKFNMLNQLVHVIFLFYIYIYIYA